MTTPTPHSHNSYCELHYCQFEVRELRRELAETNVALAIERAEEASRVRRNATLEAINSGLKERAETFLVERDEALRELAELRLDRQHLCYEMATLRAGDVALVARIDACTDWCNTGMLLHDLRARLATTDETAESLAIPRG